MFIFIYTSITIVVTILIIILCISSSSSSKNKNGTMQSTNNNIMLVGNGPQKEKNGEFINSFERVVRFNGFTIKGYEEYVGTKITDWIVNYPVYKKCEKNDTLIKGVNIICAGHPDPNMKLEVAKGVTVIDNYTRSKTFPTEIYEKYYKNYYLEDNEGVVYPYFPTSGLLAIFYYLSLYDQINISGFTFYDKSQKKILL